MILVMGRGVCVYWCFGANLGALNDSGVLLILTCHTIKGQLSYLLIVL